MRLIIVTDRLSTESENLMGKKSCAKCIHLSPNHCVVATAVLSSSMSTTSVRRTTRQTNVAITALSLTDPEV